MTDKEVKHLAEADNLEKLYLGGTEVTDDGVEHLEDEDIYVSD